MPRAAKAQPAPAPSRPAWADAAEQAALDDEPVPAAVQQAIEQARKGPFVSHQVVEQDIEERRRQELGG